jgi:hypothetical protein
MGDDDLTDWIAEDLWRATRYTGRRHWATGPAWLGLTEAEKRHWRRLAASLLAEPSPNRAPLEVHRPLDASRSGESSCDDVVAEQAAETAGTSMRTAPWWATCGLGHLALIGSSLTCRSDS